MDKIRQQALQVAKEIVVKFIEVGRISPSNFSEIFPAVYNDVLDAVTAREGLDGAKGPDGREG